MLQKPLQQFGYGAGRDTLRADIAWLAEQDCVTVEEVGGVMVARLTVRAGDAAVGRTTIPSIARPSP